MERLLSRSSTASSQLPRTFVGDNGHRSSDVRFDIFREALVILETEVRTNSMKISNLTAIQRAGDEEDSRCEMMIEKTQEKLRPWISREIDHGMERVSE